MPCNQNHWKTGFQFNILNYSVVFLQLVFVFFNEIQSYIQMHVIFIAIGIRANRYVASLATQPCNAKSFSIIDLMLLPKKALDTQNTMTQNLIFENAGFFSQGFCKSGHTFHNKRKLILKSFLSFIQRAQILWYVSSSQTAICLQHTLFTFKIKLQYTDLYYVFLS